jgi:hypothetical protein
VRPFELSSHTLTGSAASLTSIDSHVLLAGVTGAGKGSVVSVDPALAETLVPTP